MINKAQQPENKVVFIAFKLWVGLSFSMDPRNTVLPDGEHFWVRTMSKFFEIKVL
ncbi:hypothetical protein [Vibrio lentus]|uniref:hypothetical protein n=1 Tax=Vibrio lentus TaxID=136468 RepID=UPI0039A77D70